KQQLINGLGAYVEKRLNTLPLCASPLPSPDFDPFIASCRPGAVPIALIAQGTKSDLTKRPDFLGNTTITADTLKIKQTNAAGQDEEIPVFSQTQVKRIPLLYRVGRFLPVLLGVVAIGVAVCVVWLYHDHYKGLRRIATSLLIAGVLTGLAMVATVVGNLQLHRQLLGAKTSSAVGQFAGSLVDVIAHDINRILLWFTLGFLLSGAALLLVRKAAGPKAPKQKTSPQPEIDNNPPEPTAPKPKTLIQ
ncbi:MAG TPA: hypothetical protein VLE69_03465, partial [Candidatus Saccharimonadales bacterium]|nr:hypothetical protein [Candidatus Saccharimonadales bacterium]